MGSPSMILLDTHIWVWLVTESDDLSLSQRQSIEGQVEGGLGVSVFSCWEVAKLVEREKLTFSVLINVMMKFEKRPS